MPDVQLEGPVSLGGDVVRVLGCFEGAFLPLCCVQHLGEEVLARIVRYATLAQRDTLRGGDDVIMMSFLDALRGCDVIMTSFLAAKVAMTSMLLLPTRVTQASLVGCYV